MATKFKDIRAKLEEYRLGDNPTARDPSQKAFLNKHLLIQYKNFSIPVADDKVFKATNIAFRGGARTSDNTTPEDLSQGYRTPVCFGDYVSYLTRMEGTELTDEENMILETVLNHTDEAEVAEKLAEELTVEEIEEITEAHHIPLKGHAYHKKPNDHLHYIIKDAGEAAKNMKGHDDKAEGKYLDQVNDAHTVLGYRKKHGHSVGYHRTVKEHVELEEMTSSQIRKVWEKAARAKESKGSSARAQIRKADEKVVKEGTSPVPQIKAKKSFSDYVKKSDDNLKKTDKVVADGAKDIDDAFKQMKDGSK